MKTLTTSLYAICLHPLDGTYYTENKEYPVFKITEGRYGQEITIVDNRGCLVKERAQAFRFVTK